MTEEEWQNKFKDYCLDFSNDPDEEFYAKKLLYWCRKNPPPEVIALVEALKSARSVGEIKFKSCVLSSQVNDQINEAIDTFEKKVNQ